MENTINIRKNQKKMDTYSRNRLSNRDELLAEQFVDKVKKILVRLSSK